ncbi:RNA polymerase sigma-70 factor [Carboxylicivirga sp. A043]|uniref:RNA polymerase sigma factor n=1 Tax=Carboxylicivirga litoralis TaxID=2816963 RepID=UPI0021CAE975|nr:RNA polymerase sigma-70 factor [Carboxylicivirga sp. A043]MCU4154757.1 RNA polymerase sigma-70 factor [Carboxylicivirga sp. A043]
MSSSSVNINLQLIQQGNHLEFARLLDGYSHDLFLFAKGILNDSVLAEEAVSDVFVKVWESHERLEQVSNLKSYLFSSVRNQAISYLRSKKNRDIVSIEDITTYYFEPVDPTDDSELEEEKLQKILKAIDYLPAQTRMVFSLAKVQGLKYKEIAEILDIKVKTVDYHVASAIKKICEAIEKEDKANTQQILKVFLGLLAT